MVAGQHYAKDTKVTKKPQLLVISDKPAAKSWMKPKIMTLGSELNKNTSYTLDKELLTDGLQVGLTEVSHSLKAGTTAVLETLMYSEDQLLKLT